MTTPDGSKASVVKLALKRADVAELIGEDDTLRDSPFVRAVGGVGQALFKQAVARRYPDKAVLFQQGDSGGSLVLVLRGEVRLSARGGSDSVEVGTARRGEVFGEAEVLSGETLRGCNAVAQGDVDAAEFPREALLVGGVFPRELALFLGPIRATRKKALRELTDFLNRW